MWKRIVMTISLVLLFIPSFSSNMVYEQAYDKWHSNAFVANDSFIIEKNKPFKVSASNWYDKPSVKIKVVKKGKDDEPIDELPSIIKFKMILNSLLVFCPMLLLCLLVYVTSRVLERIYTKRYCLDMNNLKKS